MSQIHELLAAEKTITSAWTALFDETLTKLGKEPFFAGETVSLKMLTESPVNPAIEAAARTDRKLPTNVLDTLDYAFDRFVKAEDLQYQKNLTNAKAKADLMFNGQVLLPGLPVDQLLGLEDRLGKIRTLIMAVPTIDAAIAWTFKAEEGCWVAPPTDTSKTEKTFAFIEMSPATKEHKAQIKELPKDEVVGTFTRIKRSGAATAVQKSNAILVIDELLAETKKARMRANTTEVVAGNIGLVLKELILASFRV